MTPNLDLSKLNQQLGEWLRLIAAVDPRQLPAESRILLEQAVEQVRRGQAVLNTASANEAATIQQGVAAVQEMNAETPAQVRAVREALAAAPATAPEPPRVVVDPRLGHVLAKEILARYGARPAAPPRKASTLGEVHDLSSGTWREAEQLGHDSSAESPLREILPGLRQTPATDQPAPPQRHELDDSGSSAWKEPDPSDSGERADDSRS